MTFNIRQLDEIDPEICDEEKALEDYQDALLKQFFYSPEGQARLQDDPGMCFWAAQLIDYGYGHIGVTIPRMSARDVEEIVTEIFPRKISLSSPDDADHALPELIAFWEYLKRQYMLTNANSILRFLRKINPDYFKKIMNDPSRFGMAKSFFMMGQEAGFDMTSEEGSHAFMHFYNAHLLADHEEFPVSHPSLPGPPISRKAKAKNKKRRKMAKASRKRARKKRK